MTVDIDFVTTVPVDTKFALELTSNTEDVNFGLYRGITNQLTRQLR